MFGNGTRAPEDPYATAACGAPGKDRTSSDALPPWRAGRMANLPSIRLVQGRGDDGVGEKAGENPHP